MSDILSRIASYKREEVEAAKSRIPASELEARIADCDSPRGFESCLRSRIERGEYALIGEIKKASPSKGVIRSDFDPPSLALAYESGGASCLSVLTDEPSFQGSPEHLSAARRRVNLPLLRKDFMIDPYQVLEARCWGADCILIILAMLDDDRAREIEEEAFRLGMDALIETHDEAEMERALRSMRSDLIGINNRDLKTFDVSLEASERLSRMAEGERLLVAESGLSSPSDLARLSRSGIRAFLIGESLMRQSDVASATRTLLSDSVASESIAS